jgi:hypothetical protein
MRLIRRGQRRWQGDLLNGEVEAIFLVSQGDGFFFPGRRYLCADKGKTWWQGGWVRDQERETDQGLSLCRRKDGRTLGG